MKNSDESCLTCKDGDAGDCPVRDECQPIKVGGTYRWSEWEEKKTIEQDADREMLGDDADYFEHAGITFGDK